jgi:membrane protein DedA with SNARE-associated domain
MDDGSSSLSAWLMAASFLDTWIWAWQGRIQVNDFFLKIDFWMLVGNNRYEKLFL